MFELNFQRGGNAVKDGAAAGFLTVFPDGAPLPATSNLNFTGGQTVANLAVVPLGPTGAIRVQNNSSAPVQVIVDVSGYYAAGVPTAPGTLATLPAQRVMDSRIGTGGAGAIAGQDSFAVSMAGVTGLPSEGVSAVIVNVTVTGAATDGFLTIFPDGTAVPETSNLNFIGGQTVANLAVVPLGPDGLIRIHNGSPGDVQIIVDIAGYFLTGAVTAAGAFVAVPSDRLLDSRITDGPPPPRWPGGTRWPLP